MSFLVLQSSCWGKAALLLSSSECNVAVIVLNFSLSAGLSVVCNYDETSSNSATFCTCLQLKPLVCVRL